ncbi:MAG: beta-lactamase family protein [Acidimicrobiia bacterium]|nr:beta-lactamase family protein [Acidimicrobiia bacterium]
MSEKIDQILSAGVGPSGVAGVSAVVVSRDGTIYEGAFGERQLGEGEAMTVDTVGWIASMTKAVTGAAAMQLVEQGKLDLDRPAADICQQLGDVAVLDGFSDAGEPVTREPSVPVTLRQLLTHTSGFAYEIWDERLARYLEVTGEPSILTLQEAALGIPLMFDPGSAWEYGIGIDWAGQMVEEVSGLTLGEYFAEHLTGPLGMDDTAFAPTSAMLERAAGMHARTEDGTLAPMELPQPENPEFEMGGGGLNSTMADYSRFLRMILNDGELEGTRVLRPETVQQMAANNIGHIRVSKMTTAAPAYSNDAEFFPGDPKSWGLTFQINEVEGHTGRPAGTLMWAGLANSFYWIDRTNGVAGCYLTQILPFADQPSLGLYYDFETALYDALAGQDL